MRRIGLHALAALLMLWTSLACSPSASTDRVVTLASEPVAAAPTHEVALGYGRVVDEQGAPVADATVELKHGDRLLGRAMSGADGKFEMRGPLPTNRSRGDTMLTARGPAASLAVREGVAVPLGRAGASLADLDPRGANWCELILEPSHSLEVQVRGSAGPVTVTAGTLAQESRHILDTQQVTAPGTVNLVGLPNGPIHVFAGDGQRGGYATAEIPSDSSVEVELAELRDAEIQVVEEQTGAPIAGAEVSAQLVETVDFVSPFGGYAPYAMQLPHVTWRHTATTDNTGVARLSGLVHDAIYDFRARVAGYELAGASGTPRFFPWRAPSEERMVLVFERAGFAARQFGYAVRSGGAPPEGAFVQIFEPRPGGADLYSAPTAVGRIQGSYLFMDPIHGLDSPCLVARAPDGSLALLEAQEEHHQYPAVVFSTPRSVEVTVRDSFGKPCAELAVAMAVSAQSATVAGPTTMYLWSVYAWTDSTGTARFNGLPPGSVSVRVQHRDFPRYHLEVGETNLADGDASFDAVWRPVFRAIATVTTNGKPGWRGSCEMRPSSSHRSRDGGREVFELPSPVPGETTPIYLYVFGFESATAALTPNPDGSTVYFKLNLKRDYEVVVRTRGFEGVKLTAERVATTKPRKACIEERSVKSLEEKQAPSPGAIYTARADGAEVHIPLAEGTWRIVDLTSGATSDEFELQPESPTAEVYLWPGPFAELRVQVTPPKNGHSLNSIKVAARRLGESPDQMKPLTRCRVAGIAQVFELERGLWSLWIDAGEDWAPNLVECVDVGVRGATVGPLELSRGSTLRVRVQADATGARPHVYVNASLNSAPQIARAAQSQGEAEVLLSGLCAGVYTVRIFDTPSTDIGPARQIEFDGTNEVTIDWKP